MAEDAKQNVIQQQIKSTVQQTQGFVQQQNTVSKPITPPQNPYENKRVNKPLGTSSGSAFSLKNVVDHSTKEQAISDEILRDDLPRNSYTLEAVETFWNKFLEKLKIENNIPSYNALATTTVHLKEDNVIVLEFISASSETEYEIYKSRIMNGLRNAIQNFYFTIEVQFSESEAKSHILTSKQKFELFVDKNPIILKLKEEFGLDLYE